MDPSVHNRQPQDKVAGAYADAAVDFATSLLENASDLVAALDTDLRFVALNAAFRREFELVFGRPVALGQRVDEALAHVTGDRDKALALCRRALAGDSFRVTEEFGDAQFLRKTYELAFSPIFDTHRQALMAAVVMRDLTTQRESERRFGALLEAAPDAMIIVRSDGVIDLANAHAERLFHYGRHELNGFPVERLLPERFRPNHLAHRQQFMAQSSARPMGSGRTDLLGLRADGTEFPVEISLSPLDVGDEKMVVGAIRDMTVRQHGEDRLRQLSAELEQRVADRAAAIEQADYEYRVTFEQATVGMAHVAPDGRWLRVNQALCDIVGYTREEMREVTFQDLTHPEDLDTDLRLVQQLLNGEIPSYTLEKRYRHKNGTVVWINLNASLVQDNTGVAKYLIAVINNISDRKRAEQAVLQQQEVLQQLNERLALALKAGRSGWFDWDARQNKNHWSDELLALYGLQPSEFGGKAEDWLDCLLPEDREAGAAAIQNSMAKGDFSLEFRIRRRDTGEIRWMHARAQVVFDDVGIPTMMTGINVNVTEQKLAEKKSQDSEARFHMLADHIAQFAWITDETGAHVWYNKRWFEYTGTTPEQMQGWGWQQVHHPDHIERVMKKFRRCITEGTIWEDTFPLRGRDGQYRWFLSHAVPIRDAAGRVQQWFGTNTDITGLRQVEQALRDSERRYTALFNNKTNAIAHLSVITDVEGRPVDFTVEKINNAYEWVTGIKRENIEGRKLTDVFPGIEHYEFDFIGTYGKIALEGGETSFEVNFTYLKQWLSIYAYSPGYGECTAIFTDVTANKLAQAALRDSEAQLRVTFEQAAVGIVHLSVPQRRFLRVNQAFCRIVGYEPDELLALTVTDLTHPDDISAYEAQYARLFAGQLDNFTMEKRYVRKDGVVIWVRKTFSAVRDQRGSTLYGLSVVEDITQAKQAELARQEAANRLQLAVSIANLGFWEWDMVTDDIYYSAQWKRQLGYEEHELPNGTREWQVRLHPDDRDRVQDYVANCLATPRADFQLEYRLRHRDGLYRSMVSNALVMTGPVGQVEKLIGTQLDVTEARQAEQRVLEAAQHDSLTGLPNRALVFEYASHLLAGVRRNPRRGAFLFIDLDRFKPINDLYGHGVGDRLLREVATRLVGCVRDEDLVGRLGGDEFVIMLPHIGGQQATTVALHVLDALSRPIDVDGHELVISASVGISYFPEHGMDVDGLIHAADLAMYQAKQGGRAGYHVYTPALSHTADAASFIEAQLRRALKRGGLSLHYQPVVDMRSHRLICVEALLRLVDTDGRSIGPDRFIPIAEAAGLIGELGEWVAVEACRQHAKWREQGWSQFTIAINVSPLQFRQRSFAQRLQSILQDAHMDANCFQIEVTESTVMDSVDEAIDTLTQIKAMGIKIALDDFGTGYSSLSQLSRLPLDKLKVDQSFVKRLEHDRTSRAITGAIISLGRTLNLEVVGEGIESESAFAYLQENGCDQAQGYYLSKPLSAEGFTNWYRAEISNGSHAR
jgi:diguanylate cyclase (GGDEF)-like protein/PAS domain S-box-containing protein